MPFELGRSDVPQIESTLAGDGAWPPIDTVFRTAPRRILVSRLSTSAKPCRNDRV